MAKSDLEPEQRLCSIDATARSLSIGKTKLYELLAAGDLDYVVIGDRRFIPAAVLDEYVERLRRERTGGSRVA